MINFLFGLFCGAVIGIVAMAVVSFQREDDDNG